MNENKRPLKFMLGTLLAGLIIAGGMYLYNKGLEAQTGLQNTQHTTPNTNDSENCQTEIQNKIDGLKYVRDLSPSDYNAILIEITSSVEINCFPQVTADMFTRRLNDEYSSLMIKKLKELINEQDPVDFVGIKDYLTHLKSLGIVRADIQTIEDDLYQIEYYSVILPNKAIDFTKTISFEDLYNNQAYIDLFNGYRKELFEKPNLPERFSEKTSITEACNKAIEKINKYLEDLDSYLNK